MRKTWKSALSFVLSAAMVLTAGVVAPNVKSDAADDAPWFTATLQQNSAAGFDANSVTVTGPGEYSIEVTAKSAYNIDSASGGCIWMSTDLKALPTDYEIVAKTVQVGDKSYDWSKAPLFMESSVARLNVHNQWGPDEDKTRPLKGQGVKIASGDVIKVTFEVQAEATPTPSPTPDPDATPTPTPWFTATLQQNGAIWGWGGSVSAGETASVNVIGPGDYTIKVTANTTEAAGFSNTAGAMWLQTDLTALPANYTVVGKTIKVNDESYDWSKAELMLEDDKGRLNIWNEWNATATSNPLGDAALSGAKGDTVEVTFTVEGGDIVEPTPGDEPTPTPAAPWFTAELMNNGGIYGYDDEPGGPADDDVLKVDVTGYGEYTLKGTAAQDFSNGKGAMWVSTNLEAVPTDYTVVGKTIKVGDKSYDWSKNGKMYLDETNVRLGIWNQWNGTDEANPVGDIEGVAGDVVEFTFTVKENDTITATPTPVPSPTPVVPPTKVDGLEKGKTFTAGSLKYKVTKAATITGTKKTAGTVTVTGLAKKKATSINVKNTVKNTVNKSTASYKVTAISKKAFQKAAKLKKATLGSAIKTIPASAFNGCKKLTTVKATGAKKIAASAFKGCKALKSVTFAKLSSVKKGAFKGCKKTIKVGGKKAVKKANVKKLKKTGYKKFK